MNNEPQYEEFEERGPNYLVITLVVLAVIAVAAFAYFVISGTNNSPVARESSPPSSSVVASQQPAEEGQTQQEDPVRPTQKPEDSEPSGDAPRPEDPALPAGAVAVNDSARSATPGGDLNSVWKSGATSEEFALAVRDAYVDAYLDGNPDEFNHVVEVLSPVTNRPYRMDCKDNGEFVHCAGGEDAHVYIA